MCKYMLVCSLIDVGILYMKKALDIQFNVHNRLCAALAMQHWCWKCLDNSLCLKMYRR